MGREDDNGKNNMGPNEKAIAKQTGKLKHLDILTGKVWKDEEKGKSKLKRSMGREGAFVGDPRPGEGEKDLIRL